MEQGAWVLTNIYTHVTAITNKMLISVIQKVSLGSFIADPSPLPQE